MADQRSIDLGNRIKACMDKHGLTERDLLLIQVRRHLRNKDIVSAIRDMPARFIYDIAESWQVRMER